MLGRLDPMIDLAERPSVADLVVYGHLRMLRSGLAPEVNALTTERHALVAHMGRVEQAAKTA